MMCSIVKLNLIILLVVIYLSSNAFAKVESPISNEEAEAIQKLRIQVERHLTQDYMKDDHYLLRFLRYQNLKVNKAYDQIMQMLKWRKQNNLDTILDENYDLERYFPYDLVYDRDGRPVATGKLIDFKLRRYLIAGRKNEIIHTAYKMIEFALLKMREASAKTGTNITSGIIIGDVSGFNFREHACGLCIQLGLEKYTEYEANYPHIAYKLVAVNTPRIAVALYETYKHLASEQLRSTVSIYGYDKSQWVPELLKIVAKEQLPTYLGGTYSGARYLGNKRIGE